MIHGEGKMGRFMDLHARDAMHLCDLPRFLPAVNAKLIPQPILVALLDSRVSALGMAEPTQRETHLLVAYSVAWLHGTTEGCNMSTWGQFGKLVDQAAARYSRSSVKERIKMGRDFFAPFHASRGSTYLVGDRKHRPFCACERVEGGVGVFCP